MIFILSDLMRSEYRIDAHYCFSELTNSIKNHKGYENNQLVKSSNCFK